MEFERPHLQFAEKIKNLSFRGTLRAEESLFLCAFTPREIPHFVRNDAEKTISASFSGGHFGFKRMLT